MAEYLYTSTLTVARPREQVFDFFSRAENLELITPPELNFHIVTPTPIKIEKGTLIDYRLSMQACP